MNFWIIRFWSPQLNGRHSSNMFLTNQSQTIVKRERKFSRKYIFETQFEKLYPKVFWFSWVIWGRILITQAVTRKLVFLSTGSQIKEKSVKIGKNDKKGTYNPNKQTGNYSFSWRSGYYSGRSIFLVCVLLFSIYLSDASSLIPPTIIHTINYF